MSGLGKHDNKSFGSLAHPTGHGDIYFQRVNGTVFKYIREGRQWAIQRIASPLPYLSAGWWEQSGQPIGYAASLRKCLDKARAS